MGARVARARPEPGPVNELRQWFEAQARRAERAVFLEEALLGNRFWDYAYYRLRFFFARYAVASVTHAVTVLLLYRFFDRTHFVIVLLAYAVASVVTNFWWGSLEALRTEVRSLYRRRAPHLIPKTIGRWLSLALQLAAVTALATTVWLGVDAARNGGVKPADLYVFAIGLRLSVQFFSRAYHAGIYAIRRIYRPLPAILGVEVLGIVVALLLAPFLGAWALPVGALIGVPIVAGLSIMYTRRAYRFLGISPSRFVEVARLQPPPRRAFRDFFGGGISYALIGLDSLLVIVLFTTDRSGAGKTGLFALLFLLSPTVRAGSEWAQLIYFDLKRLEIRVFRNLRRRFEADILRLALVLGVIFACVAFLVGARIYRAPLGDLALALGPFFVAISLLAWAQIRAYSDRAYPALIATGSAYLAGFVAVGWTVPGETATVLALTGVALAGFVCLELRPDVRAEGDGATLLSPTEWIAELRLLEVPVRVSSAQFYADPAAATPEGDDDRWRRLQVGDRIALRLPRPARAALLEPGLLAWYEPARKRTLDRPALATLGGGLLHFAGEKSAQTGSDALWTAARAGLLGRELAVVAADPSPPPSTQELRSSFESMFTSGIVYAPDEPVPVRLDALPAEDKRAVVAGAVAYARELRSRPLRSRFLVTAFCERGELRLVFLVSRRAPDRLRARWEELITRSNLRAALAAPE